MTMLRLLVGMIFVASLWGLCSCEQAGADPPERAAQRFVSALRAGDGARACFLLTERARSSVSGATDVPCATAVKNVPDKDSTVHGVQLWGDAAQVRIGSDVVFLRRLEAGWRISGAACTPRPRGPYDCDVSG